MGRCRSGATSETTKANQIPRASHINLSFNLVSSGLRARSQKKAGPSRISTLAVNQTGSQDQIMSYKSFVAARAQRNSCLQNLCDFLQNNTKSQHACRIVCLEFSSASGPPSCRSLDLDGLALLLQSTAKERDNFCGRLLIVEDLSSDIVETLGSTLNIDPIFFASHIDTFQVDIAATRPSTAILPSTARSQNFLNLHYHRVLEFEHLKSKQVLLRDMNVPRKVKILPRLKGIDVGLARHCCSTLKTEGKDGSWLGERILINQRVVGTRRLTNE